MFILKKVAREIGVTCAGFFKLLPGGEAGMVNSTQLTASGGCFETVIGFVAGLVFELMMLLFGLFFGSYLAYLILPDEWGIAATGFLVVAFLIGLIALSRTAYFQPKQAELIHKSFLMVNILIFVWVVCIVGFRKSDHTFSRFALATIAVGVPIKMVDEWRKHGL